MNQLPTFLCIGAQRAGSTWLHRNLQTHAGIWLPPVKELHYFDELRTAPFLCKRYKTYLRNRIRANGGSLRRGKWSVADFRWDTKFFARPRSDRWYASLFSQGRGRPAGEITPAYSRLPTTTIKDIKRLNPHLKIIFIMRDPIDRAWSQARKDLPRVYGRPVSEISAADVTRWFSESWCAQRSDYVAILDNWLPHFPRDQFFIGFFEELASDPQDLLLRLFKFLGAESSMRHIAKIAEKPVNAAARIDLPAAYEYELARLYEPQLATLKELFQPYPDRWHRRCIDVLNARDARAS